MTPTLTAFRNLLMTDKLTLFVVGDVIGRRDELTRTWSLHDYDSRQQLLKGLSFDAALAEVAGLAPLRVLWFETHRVSGGSGLRSFGVTSYDGARFKRGVDIIEAVLEATELDDHTRGETRARLLLRGVSARATFLDPNTWTPTT